MLPDLRPSFFKILSSGQNMNTLHIPPEFRKHIVMGRQKRATLRDCSGAHWLAEVKKQPEGIVLENGWEKFVEDHGLGHDEFLIFIYNGELRFDVQIFEKSGCEQVDFSTAKQDQQRPPHAHPRDSHICPKSSKFERGRQLQTSGEPRHPLESKDKFQSRSKAEGSKQPGQMKNQTAEPGEIFASSSNTTMSAELDSRNPYFTSNMKPYNVMKNFMLYVPNQFTAHLPTGRTNLILRNSKGNTWKVTYINNTVQKRHYFSGGWVTFVKDNNVKVGNTCLFELVAENVLQVHIDRTKRTYLVN